MKKTSGLIHLTPRLKNVLYWVMLSSVLLSAAACAEGYQSRQAPSHPSYSAPEYYGGPGYPYSDPEFWLMRQSRQGGG